MSTQLGTIITAMVTPFTAELEVDHDRLAELAVRLLDQGSDGLVVAGTTGECPTLSDAEKLAMFRTVRAAVGGRAVVIAGTGSNDTRHTVELTQAATACGVDGVLVVAPYYNKPPQRGLLAHFRAAAAATDLPLVIYNIPGRCGVNMTPETLAELSQVENIVAVKQANPDLQETRRLLELCDLGVYAGNDDMLLDVLALDGLGGICVASHIVGPRFAEMARLMRTGEREAAAALDAGLHGLYKALFVTSNPIPVKRALHLMGKCQDIVRLPLVPLSDENTQRLQKEMRAMGVLS